MLYLLALPLILIAAFLTYLAIQPAEHDGIRLCHPGAAARSLAPRLRVMAAPMIGAV